ncbi:MAG: hypothetical protein IJ447_05480 [Clostridia bacterium]|nr:hypothetical protein [Clostridia bacterium]
MDAVFEFFAELFLEAFGEIFVEPYLELMSLFGRDCKKIKKEKLKIFVVFESVVLLLMFFLGLCFSLAKEWTSILWKAIFIISVVVPAVQIGLGLILMLLKKIRKRNRR